MKKEPVGLKSTSNKYSPPAITNKDYDYNFSNQSNYKKFSNFLKESKSSRKQQQKKKTKHLECNCLVCKILDSSSVTDKTKKKQQNAMKPIISFQR